MVPLLQDFWNNCLFLGQKAGGAALSRPPFKDAGHESYAPLKGRVVRKIKWAYCKIAFYVILNEVKDLNLFNKLDSSLRSE
jgi:hypothetical protein